MAETEKKLFLARFLVPARVLQAFILSLIFLSIFLAGCAPRNYIKADADSVAAACEPGEVMIVEGRWLMGPPLVVELSDRDRITYYLRGGLDESLDVFHLYFERKHYRSNNDLYSNLKPLHPWVSTKDFEIRELGKMPLVHVLRKSTCSGVCFFEEYFFAGLTGEDIAKARQEGLTVDLSMRHYGIINLRVPEAYVEGFTRAFDSRSKALADQN